MSVRAVPVLLVLTACACDDLGGGFSGPDGDDQQPIPCQGSNPGCTYDQCNAGLCVDIPVFVCDETTGEWVEQGVICEGILVDVTGDLLLVQSVVGAADSCPALAPRNPLALSVQDDGSVTAPAPIEILEGSGTGGWEQGTVFVTLVDIWGAVTPTVDYDLAVSADAEVEGGATVTAPDCDAELEVRGMLCPRGVEQCAVHDDGWNVFCYGGAVFSDDLTRYAFCLPGTTDEVCEIGGAGNAARVAECAAGCADTTNHWFETVDEYNAFDPSSLCSP
jgi:hypothetical protein